MSEPINVPRIEDDGLGTPVDQFIGALEVFQRLASAEDANGQREPYNICRVYDATINTELDHNCLSCSLKTLLSDIEEFLSVVVERPEIFIWNDRSPLGFKQFVFLVNVFWEAVRDTFGIVDYQQDDARFGTFIELRRWANFFKHPGVFGYLMHEPKYNYQDSPVEAASDTTVVITSEVVKKNWKSGVPGKEQKLPKTLFAHKTTAVVILPNIFELALRLEKEVTTIADILSATPFSQRLTEKSTIEDYFQA